jgi:hypothetical protein
LFALCAQRFFFSSSLGGFSPASMWRKEKRREGEPKIAEKPARTCCYPTSRKSFTLQFLISSSSDVTRLIAGLQDSSPSSLRSNGDGRKEKSRDFIRLPDDRRGGRKGPRRRGQKSINEEEKSRWSSRREREPEKSS